MRNFFIVFLFSLASSLLLCLFAFIPTILKYAFSLGAFLTGLKFFSTYDSWKMRGSYLASSIVLFFIWIMLYTVFAFAYDWPLPEGVVPEEQGAAAY
ncbi:hypothetical protein [Marinicrinis lubricantis]|uniref:Uncharacterized protein n=1 Tax=Marinicrinis lubricantis TaxID=2086470 RepID=A0ABW1IMP5_9BACL